MLPILTFDQRILSPSFGYWFDSHWIDPYESIVSILWKYARMNGLAGHVLASELARREVDPYEGVPATRAEVNIRHLRDILGLQLKRVRGAVIPDSLQRSASPHLRFCLACMRRGYHGVVHQFEAVQMCPIHGSWLFNECPRCGRSTSYRLNAKLLDAPFRCAECRTFYGISPPAFECRRPLKLQQRVDLTRATLRYYAC